MGGAINLRQARKLRDRAKKREQATENAAIHGESKARRALREATAERARAALDGARRDTGSAGPAAEIDAPPSPDRTS
ncbi:MAG: DUF4169 family protein [Rhodobacteraceae bacterium]|nr:DUF4169 family protein [Paracoccaceae bacterium]